MLLQAGQSWQLPGQSRAEGDEAEVQKQFQSIDVNGDGRIDVWEFEKWMKVLRRQDAKYAEGLNRIGHKMGWAKIKIPTVKNKDRSKYKPSRTQKRGFLEMNLREEEGARAMKARAGRVPVITTKRATVGYRNISETSS